MNTTMIVALVALAVLGGTSWMLTLSRRSRTSRSAPPRRRSTKRRVTPRRPARTRRSTVRSRAGRGGRGAPAGVQAWKFAGAAVAVTVVGLGAFLLGAFKPPVAARDVALRIAYTAQTAEDSHFSLPESVWADLRGVGLRHESIALTRIDSTGEVATSVIDLTPRVDAKPDSAPLIAERARPAIDRKIAAIEATMNSTTASSGSRTLFTGLTKIDSTVPIYVVSSGLDLVDPVSFIKLNWTTPPQQVVDNIKQSGEMPHLQGPVTFVVVPAAGAQEQLRAKQAAYRNGIWDDLLKSAGATSVTFLDAIATAGAGGPDSAPVAVSALPDTPIVPVTKPNNPRKATCTVPTAFFVVNKAILLDKPKTIDALRTCTQNALAGATFELDGWTSYEGRLTPDGKPALDDPANRKLSADRVQTIADLLTSDLGVSIDRIVARRAHGNIDQPVADPRSPDNRRVDITYTVK